MGIVIEKKHQQLGMNSSTAQYRLVKDILYNFVKDTGNNACFHCGGQMSRDTFSIEHKTPWLDSEDPKGLFFDLSNISYSHLSCNTAARRTGRPAPVCGTVSKYTTGCKCVTCLEAWRAYKRKRYDPDTRRAKYERKGN